MYVNYLQLPQHGRQQLIAAELEEWRDVAPVFEHMRHLPYALLLESSSAYQNSITQQTQSSASRYSFATAEPELIFSSSGTDVTIFNQQTGEIRHTTGRILDIASEWLQRNLISQNGDPDGIISELPPFLGGLAGFIGYEYGQLLEKVSSKHYDLGVPIPDAVLGAYTWTVAWDHSQKKCWLIAPERDIDKLSMLLFKDSIKPLQAQPKRICANPVNLSSSFSKSEYYGAIETTREYIRAGDIFQANITQRFSTDFSASAWDLYRHLRDTNSAPFASYFDFGDAQIVSVSPERFLKLDINRIVETRPIKGTRPRGKSKDEDLVLIDDLLLNAKDQAEHIMIVDVLRNDISRVCEYGTVSVPHLMYLETHPSVHHLVSVITGRLRKDRSSIDLVHACFPGGSITGAPKIRAMEIINELEPTPRNVYCGSIGYFGISGTMDSSIAIRTVVVNQGRAFFSAGGGIVAESDPAGEYQESLDKAHAIIEAISCLTSK